VNRPPGGNQKIHSPATTAARSGLSPDAGVVVKKPAVKLWAATGLLVGCVAGAEQLLTERAQRHALRDEAVALLRQQDFEALEQLAGRLRCGAARFEDGSWQLAYFYESLDALTVRFNTEAWEKHLAGLRRWCEEQPESVTARIVLAHALMSRGGPAAPAAKEILEQARRLPAQDPEWHRAWMRFWRAQPGHATEFERAYREAIAFEPGYHSYYVAKAEYVCEHGGPRAVERFAAETGDDVLYTRSLMWLLWRERDEFFDSTGASWQRMKRGFHTWQSRHPTSLWVANNFCMFACMAGDTETARAQFERIGPEWNPYVWRNEGRFQQWRAWAQGRAARPAKAERPRELRRPYTGGPILDREVLMERVAALLLGNDYDALEELGRQFRTSKERLPEGLWKLQFYYAALARPPKEVSGGEEWTYWLGLLQNWKQARPGSVAAPIALAAAHIGHAWAGRGGEFAAQVTEPGWELYRQRIAAARRLLEQSEAQCSADPHWHTLMMRVARAQSWDGTAMQQLFERAIAREPAYHPHYFERAQQLLPRWFGRAGELEEFAARFADTEGLYARIAWSVRWTAPDETFFQRYRFSWPRIRESYRQLEAQHPDSNWNLNQFCWFACMAGDRATARELFQRIGVNWVAECWQSEAQWQRWRQWAGTDGSAP
jgi:hypothetical protein